jgi:predicted amidohydrolase
LYHHENKPPAMQNSLYVAMCNRIGIEGNMEFDGESIIVGPNGEVVYKSNDQQNLVVKDINLSEMIIKIRYF